MDVLAVNSDYNRFLEWLYDCHDGLGDAPYDEQVEVRQNSLFGVSYFYPDNFRRAGYEAMGIYVNNERMQRAWLREHRDANRDSDPSPPRGWHRLRSLASGTPLRHLKPLVQSYLGHEYAEPSWYYDTLREQIAHYEPDVVLNQAVNNVSTDFLLEMDSHYDSLVGQIQVPLADDIELDVYDGLVSALPDFVDRFERHGIPSLELPLAFEETVLDRVDLPDESDIPAVFVGSLTAEHQSRIEWLDRVCAQCPVEVYAPSMEHVPTDSPIRDCYQGTVWGRDMYRTLARSKIILNNHIDIAGPYAANLRMYEATGVGSCLLTDKKRNLSDFFEPGDEVLTYRSPEHCADVLERYLEAEKEREAIARAGHERTLDEHTYRDRISELETFFDRI